MSTANKLTYLNTTKGKIKDAINLTNANILSEDTFRSYAEKLKLGLIDIINNGTSDLYDSFPKTTQTGTEIALNDTYEAPMEIGLNGNTHQDSYTGKNLINDYDLISRWHIASVSDNLLTTTAISSDWDTFQPITRNQTISLVQGTEYYVSFDMRLKSGTYSGRIGRALIIDTDGNGLATNESAVSQPKMTSSFQRMVFKQTAKTTTDIRIGLMIQIQQGANNAVFEIKNVMLSTSSDTTYEPYTNGASPNPDYPQQIEVVTGDNTINIHGKNLWNENTQVFINQARFNSPVKDSNNVWAFTISGSNGYAFATSNITLPAGTYTASAIVDNGDFIILKGSVTQSNTFTLTEDTEITFRVYKNGNIGDVVKLSNVMLEQGSTATSYEPYQSKDYEIDLTNNKFKINYDEVTTDLKYIPFQLEPNTNYLMNTTLLKNLNNSPNAAFIFLLNGNVTTGANTTNNGVWLDNPRVVSSDENGYITVAIRQASENPVNFNEHKTILIKADEEFYDYKLCKINDYKDKIDKSTCKNLFDKDNPNIIHKQAISNKQFNTDSHFVSIYAPAKEGKTYTISSTSNLFDTYSSLYFTSEDLNTATTYLSRTIRTPNTATSITATAPIGTKYVCAYIMYSTNQTDINSLLSTIQIEENSQATDYEPYGEQWYIKKNIGKAVLDGTQNYIKSAYSDTNYCTFITNDFNSLIGNNGQSNLLSNYFISNNIGSSIPNKTGMSYISKDYGLRFAIEYSNANDVAGFQTWLGTHNTIVYYVLATPTYEIITNETLINQLEELKKAKSVDDKTFISQINEQVPFILDVSALSKN